MGHIVEIVPKAEKEFLKLSEVLRRKICNKMLSFRRKPTALWF